MKHIIFSSVLLLASATTGEAIADCATNQVTNLGALLLNNTVCDPTATYDTSKPEHPDSGIKVMGIQEEHLGDSSGGELWDYKKGDDHPVDRRRKVGTWSIDSDGSDDATVSYIYDAFGPATAPVPYKVYATGAAGYDYCTVGGTTPVASVTLKPGTNVGCD